MIYLSTNNLDNLKPVKIHYKSFSGDNLVENFGSVIFPPDNVKCLVIGFCFHHSNKSQDYYFIESLIKHNIGIIYVCDRLPENPIINNNIVYVETGFYWFTHTLIVNPLVFSGVFHNNTKDGLKYANLFSQFTGFKIPIINDTSNLELLKKSLDLNKEYYHILIETYDGLGDVLMSLPAAYTLNKLGHKVAYLVDKSKVPVFKNLDFIHKVYIHRSEVPIHLYRHISLTHRLSAYNLQFNQQHRIYSSAFLCGLSKDALRIEKPIIVLDEEEKLYAKELLKDYKNTVGICWYAFGSNRSYFADYTQQLIDLLNKNGFTPIILGTKKENFKDCVDLTNKTDLRQLFSIVWALDAIITVDTGVLHIAGAFDKLTIALFGPIPAEWRCSTYKNCYPLQSKLRCCPCWDMQRVPVEERKCNVYESYCLRKITPRIILKTLKKVYK